MIENIIQNIKDRKDFINTPRFSELVAEFKRIVGEGNVITSEDTMYHADNYSFTAKEFNKAVETIFENYPPDYVPDNNSSFAEFATNYDNLGFVVMSGQGSSYTVQSPVPHITPVLL